MVLGPTERLLLGGTRGHCEGDDRNVGGRAGEPVRQIIGGNSRTWPRFGGSVQKVPRGARYRAASEGFDKGQSRRVQDHAARGLLVQQYALQVSDGQVVNLLNRSGFGDPYLVHLYAS